MPHHGETILLHGLNEVMVVGQVAGGCESSGKIIKDISLGLQIVLEYLELILDFLVICLID